jgi:hypothetical protein
MASFPPSADMAKRERIRAVRRVIGLVEGLIDTFAEVATQYHPPTLFYASGGPVERLALSRPGA